MPEDQQITQPPSKIKKTYDAISHKFDVGSFDQFTKDMQDPVKNKKVYDVLSKDYDIGKYDKFQEDLGLKKKDAPAGSASPSASSPNTGTTEQPVGTSGSDPKQVTANFKNNSLTPKDVGDQPLGHFLGPSPEQLTHSINNKTKNIEQAQKAPADNYVSALVRQHQDAQKKVSELSMQNTGGGEMLITDENQQTNLKNAKDHESYLRNEIQKNYDERKKKLVPELSSEVKNIIGEGNLQFNPETHTLNEKSARLVIDRVDAIMNKKKDPIVNATVSGDLDDKPRTYEDLSSSVIQQLNTIPIKKAQDEFTDKFAEKNPGIKQALAANKDIQDYFSTTNFDDVKAKVKIEVYKSFINTKQKYYGEDGLFMKNQDYVGIQHKYAQLVADKKMSDEVARKQMDAEISQNPALKAIKQNHDTEIRKIIENSSKQYEKYVIDGFKGKHPQYTAYKDGTIGLASLGEDQYKNMVEGYGEGMDNVAKKMGVESSAAWMKQANEKAKRVGPLWGSLGMALNEVEGGLRKMVFNKTGWGGEDMRHFEAKEIASPQISQSEVAATWNWKGWESVLDPNFYLSGVGKMVPVIAGTAAISLATEGTGAPAYIEWLASGGLFTAQSSLSTYSQLLNTKDAQGNMLSESDAANYAANQAANDFAPNVLMMAMGSGTLLRSKNIVKPTILKTLGRSAIDIALQQPEFAWQGYNDWSTFKEAQGKSTDIYDYMQSKDFRDNLLNGMVMGGAFSLMHAPGHYMKSMDNWENMIHTSKGEFKNLIPQNYTLGQEMAGNGKYLRDALMLHIFNTDPETLDESGKRQLADTKNQLLYSVNLDRNIKTANLDPKNVHDLYQAHNLALADQYAHLSEQAAKEKNKTLSDVYKDKEKDYREHAKAASDGTAKYHYLINEQGHPIFMSDNSFKTLEAEGTIGKWMKDGTIKDVVKSDDPEFSQRYKDFVGAKDEANVEGSDIMDHAKGLIEENKDKLGVYYAVAKDNPEVFLKNVADQVLGRHEDGSISDHPDAETAARQQYGDDIVDLAKLMYPEDEKTTEVTEEKKEQPTETRTVEMAGKIEVIKPEESGGEPEYKRTINDDPFAEQFFPEGSPEREVYDKLDEKEKDLMIDEKRRELTEKQSGITVMKPEIVPLVKAETISSPIKTESDGKTETKAEGRQDVLNEEGGDKQNLMKDSDTPPSPPPPVGPSEEGLHPRDNEWTSVQKKDLSERVQKENAFTQTNRESVDKVIGRLSRDASANGRTWQSQAEFEVNSLHDDYFNEDGSIRQAFNPTTEQLALIGIRLMDINGEASVNEFNPNDDQQTIRNAYLESEKMKAERLLSFGEAGRAFQFRQSLLKMGINGDIQIKRKAISATLGVKIPETEAEFKELSDFDKQKIKPVYDAFQKWKAEYEKENKSRNNIDEKYSQEEFEKRIKAEVAKSLKETKVPDKRTVINKERATKLSTNLKSIADRFEKFGKPNLPEGTQQAGFGPDIQKKIADAIRWVAEKIAKGDLKIPELVYEAIERFKGEGLKDSDLSDNIKASLTEAGVSDKQLNSPTNREGILGKMKEIAKNEGVKTITKDMVDKGLVRDYLHDIAKRGETDPKEILDRGVKELSESFPDTDAKKLRDAYLKEGEFTPDASKDLADQIKKSTQTFHDITVLQRDLQALEVGKSLYGADDEQKKTIISDYEKKLRDEKAKIIKDREDAIRRNKEEYQRLESERNRQLKAVADLQEKLKALQAGKRPEGSKSEPKEDTPEIEALKDDIYKADQDLRKTESQQREAQKKAEKIADYDRAIKDIDNHQRVWSKARQERGIDKDMAAKREELKQALIKNGIKLETGSKDARQTKEKVIEAHNDRVNDLKEKITDLLNDDTVSDLDKKAFQSVKAELDKMNVKIDAGDLDDKIKKAIAAAERLHTGNITNLLTGRKSEIFADLKNLSTQLKKDNNSGLQDIQLEQLKRREIARKEKAERDLAAGNFEDVPKLSDYKRDQESLKLTRDRKIAESNLAHEIDKYQKRNQSFWQRQVTRLKRLQRANLISGIMTNGKVLIAGVAKPVADAGVRRTVGTLTDPIFRTLGLKGEREALNTDATIKSFVDSFRGMTLKEAAEKRGTAEKGLESSLVSLQSANDELKALETQHGKDSPEYNKYKEDEYTKALNDFQTAQYDWAASMLYDFISPRSWNERLNILKTGTSKFEESMGGYRGNTWADEKSEHAIGTVANKIIHTLEIFGRTHGAEKDISARQAFVEGFLKRSMDRIKAGEQLTPSKLEGIALESYPNFLGGKFQNKNPVSDVIRNLQMELEKKGTGGKIASFGLGAVTPVLKVPLNIEAEGLFKYTAGLPVAIFKTFSEISKALKTNDITLKEGIKDFNGTMEAIRDHMKELPPEKRDRIIEYMNKGIFGAAMALVTGSMAASGRIVFGGAYKQGQKKRKYLDATTGEMEELNYGEIAIDGHKVGKFWSAVIMHLPPLMPAVMSATYVQKYKDERGDLKNEKDKATAAYDGLSEVVRTAWEESALKSLGDVAQAPGNIFNSFTTQMAAKNISEYFDTDESGNMIERKGENFWQDILLRTGGRKLVPTKEQFQEDKEQKQQESEDKATQLRENDPYYDKEQK